jgi:hypothetical protein
MTHKPITPLEAARRRMQASAYCRPDHAANVALALAAQLHWRVAMRQFGHTLPTHCLPDSSGRHSSPAPAPSQNG